MLAPGPVLTGKYECNGKRIMHGTEPVERSKKVPEERGEGLVLLYASLLKWAVFKPSIFHVRKGRRSAESHKVGMRQSVNDVVH